MDGESQIRKKKCGKQFRCNADDRALIYHRKEKGHIVQMQ